MLKHVLFLFFNPEALARESLRRSPNADAKQIRQNVEKLRRKIFTALFYVALVFGSTLVISGFFGYAGWHPGHRVLVWMRWAAYGFILWGVLSPTSSIETWDKDTLPEILNEEWHRLCYTLGAFLLMLSYLLEHRLHG